MRCPKFPREGVDFQQGYNSGYWKSHITLKLASSENQDQFSDLGFVLSMYFSWRPAWSERHVVSLRIWWQQQVTEVKECNEMQLLKCFLWTDRAGYLSISNLERNLTAPKVFLSLTYFLRKCEKSVANLWGHEIGCEIVRQSHETWQFW